MRTFAVRHFFGEHGSKVSIHEIPGPARAVKVPRQSYAPSELPNEAMAPRSPDRRMVPAFGGGERSCFDAKPITRLPATIRSPHRPDNAVVDDSELTCTHSPNCYANAGYRDHDRRSSGELRLDIANDRKVFQTI
jgi:hypothetical protein